MSNILAIAHKELRSYFASPIAYIVIGFWALLYGWFFINILNFFVMQSMQMGQLGMQGPQAMNVNQQMIRPHRAHRRLRTKQHQQSGRETTEPDLLPEPDTKRQNKHRQKDG